MVRHLRTFFSLAVTAVLFLSIFLPVSAAPQPPDAVTILSNEPLSDLQKTQSYQEIGVGRSQAVRLQAGTLAAAAQQVRAGDELENTVVFQLFEDLSLTASFNRHETTLQGGYILSGDLAEDPNGWITLVDTNGVISADLQYQGIQYQLRQVAADQYRFVEIDQSQFPQELDALAPPVVSQSTAQTPTYDLPQADSGALIDVMVLYTTAAKNAAGGENNILNTINLAVSETNDGYARSQVNQRMRLVHSAEVGYSESGFNWNTALSQLTSRTDNVLDQVHDWRDTYAADLVVMLVSDTTYCGIAWLMPELSSAQSGYGFSVVARSCATGYYSFAHETGHNMGAHHDRNTTTSPGIFNYSHGYQAPDNSFRTIMAYNCPGGYCTRINNWSNPNVYYNGKVTGVSSSASNSADNTLTLNNTAYYVANYRQAAPPAAPGGLVKLGSNQTSVSLGFSDNSADEESFYVQYLNGSNWQTVAVLPANTTTVTIEELTCETSATYRVLAYNSTGFSAPSNSLEASTAVCAPPEPPATINSSSSINSIFLSWDDVDGETEYIIEQSLDEAKSWDKVSSLAPDTTSFTVSGLEPNLTYIFRICVVNEFGMVAGDPITVSTMTSAVYVPLIIR